MIKLKLAEPRGFCAGVDRAIAIVNRAVDLFDSPVYVRHEVVHNRRVVSELRDRGVSFVREIDEVPDGAILIFSAHGVSAAVENEAKRRKLTLFDATCPLVSKVHMEVLKYGQQDYDCILIGHSLHPEVEGTMGRYSSSDKGQIYLVENINQAELVTVGQADKLAYVTQTTLSVDDTQAIIDVLKRRFPLVIAPRKEDICYATQNRQDAVKALVPECDLMLVVGSKNSSNSNRLWEIAQRKGCEAYLVDSADQVDKSWLEGKTSIGVTAGASAPEGLLNEIITVLHSMGVVADTVSQQKSENVYFSLPKELR